MEQKEQCFIITPIGDDTDPIRRHIEGIIDAAIIPALGDQYKIVVAHKISEPGSITKQVIDAVYNSKLVIANLTNRNPNVMYELALRHATGKPAIMIAEKGTPLPSDIIMQRTIFYHNDAKGVLELRDALSQAESEISFDDKCGPIVEVLGDISLDTHMLKQVAERDIDNKEPLAFILQRLDRIENSLSHVQRSPNLQLPSNGRRNDLSLTYSYKSRSGISERSEESVLSDQIENVFGGKLHCLTIDSAQKSILFMADFPDNTSASIVTRFITSTLREFGFRDVVLTKREFINMAP